MRRIFTGLLLAPLLLAPPRREQGVSKTTIPSSDRIAPDNRTVHTVLEHDAGGVSQRLEHHEGGVPETTMRVVSGRPQGLEHHEGGVSAATGPPETSPGATPAQIEAALPFSRRKDLTIGSIQYKVYCIEDSPAWLTELESLPPGDTDINGYVTGKAAAGQAALENALAYLRSKGVEHDSEPLARALKPTNLLGATNLHSATYDELSGSGALGEFGAWNAGANSLVVGLGGINGAMRGLIGSSASAKLSEVHKGLWNQLLESNPGKTFVLVALPRQSEGATVVVARAPKVQPSGQATTTGVAIVSLIRGGQDRTKLGQHDRAQVYSVAPCGEPSFAAGLVVAAANAEFTTQVLNQFAASSLAPGDGRATQLDTVRVCLIGGCLYKPGSWETTDVANAVLMGLSLARGWRAPFLSSSSDAGPLDVKLAQHHILNLALAGGAFVKAMPLGIGADLATVSQNMGAMKLQKLL